MLRPLCLFLTLLPGTATGQDWPDLDCGGTGPDWRLELRQDQASLTFGRSSTLDIPHSARARDGGWPLALTLVGRDDSAIVLLRPRQCALGTSTGSHEIDLLTQRGQTPVVLTGCCTLP